MIRAADGLCAYVERYLLQRDVSVVYAATLRGRVSRFCQWAQCDLPIGSLTCELVNEFLAWQQTTGINPNTVDGYRRAILCLWRAAYLDGENDCPPLRVRKIKRPRICPTAFTHDEIRALLAQAATWQNYFPNGAKRADFWIAIIHSAYSTGLRRGDLLRVKRAQINASGIADIVQQKTNYHVRVRFSEESLEAIQRMAHCGERALPWPFHTNALSRQFRVLVKAASVRPGQFRWLRRSAGSYAESTNRGNGSRLLGHRCESVFRVHYEDATIAGANPVEPPPL